MGAGNSSSPSNEFLNMKVVLGTLELTISIKSKHNLGALNFAVGVQSEGSFGDFPNVTDR